MWDINVLSKLTTEQEYLDHFNINQLETKLDLMMFRHLLECVSQFIMRMGRYDYGSAEYWVGKGDGIVQYFLHRDYQIRNGESK